MVSVRVKELECLTDVRIGSVIKGVYEGLMVGGCEDVCLVWV